MTTPHSRYHSLVNCSYERVDDGQSHTLEMLIRNKNFTMTIDDNGSARTIVNEGPNTYLQVQDDFFLGGLPSSVNTRAFKKWHIRDGTSFRGNGLGKKPRRTQAFIMDGDN